MRAVFFLLTLLAALPRGAYSQPAMGPDTMARVKAYVEEQLAAAQVPGASFALVEKNRVPLCQGWGFADLKTRRPATPGTVFEIGSLVKSMTAMAILQLRDRGVVNLKAPVQRYLPWFQVADPEASGKITLFQLLTHTSGLGTGSYEDALLGDGAGNLQIRDAVRTLRNIHLRHPPGRTYEYSNMGYNVLGAVVESVSGESFGGYIRSQILKPLGMAHTTMAGNPSAFPDVATPYSWLFGFRVPMPLGTLKRFMAPSGGTPLSTAGDMARFLQAQMGALGARILSPQSLLESHSPQVRTDTPGASYGFGWILSDQWGPRMVWHMGSTEGSSSFAGFIPGLKRGFVLLTNRRPPIFRGRLFMEGLGLGVLRILAGQEPAFTARGHWDLDQTYSRAMLFITPISIFLLFRWVLAFWRFLAGRTSPARGKNVIIRAAAATLAAALAWILAVQLLNLVPFFTLRMYLHGWIWDVGLGLGLMVVSTTLWALLGWAALLRKGQS